MNGRGRGKGNGTMSSSGEEEMNSINTTSNLCDGVEGAKEGSEFEKEGIEILIQQELDT